MTVEHTSTTAQCGSEIVGHKELMDLHAENFQLRSELTRLRNENSDLANKALSLQSELAAARKALEECRARYSGYVITKDEQYPKVLSDFLSEIRRIDAVACKALAALSSKEPEGK